MLIIATVGYTTLTEDQIRKIILAGADVIRYNFAYRNISENIELVYTAQRIIEELHSSAKILIDFPLNKIRLGDFDIKIFAVRENQELILKSAPFSPNCHEYIPVDTQFLGQKVYVDQTITIGDGEISMQVIEILNSDTIKVKILNNGVIN
jgi:pyruvate kinase